MRRLLRLGAPFLLATLVAGGVLTPSLHRIGHGAELVALRAAHVADGHHEEAGWRTHWEAPCRVPVAPPELDCAVCSGLSVHAAAPVVALVAPDALDRLGPLTEARLRPVEAVAASVRGPPAA